MDLPVKDPGIFLCSCSPSVSASDTRAAPKRRIQGPQDYEDLVIKVA